jgi:small subunit ribosomal protein S36
MGTFMTLALLTKGFALVLPPIAVLTYLVAWRRSRREFPSLQVGIVVVAGAIGGIWWLRNLLVYKAVQPPGLNDAQADEVWPPLPPGKSEHVATYAHQALDRMTTDFWGALGLTVPPSLPGVITFIASVVAVALLVTGFFAAAATTRRARVIDLGVVLLPTILVVVPLLLHGWADYSRTGQLIGIQGRYLYPGFVGLVAIAAVGADLLVGVLPPIAARLLPLLACVLALAIEVSAVDIVCTKLWFHNGSLLHGGASKVAHAIGATGPWPGTITLGMLAFPIVTGLVALIAAVRETTRRSSEPPPVGIFAA